MRWLVLGSRSDDSFAENISATLEHMGQEVAAMPRSSEGRVASLVRRARVARDLYRGGTSESAERWAVRMARAWRPQVVIAPTIQLTEEGLAELRAAGVIARVAWWGDPPANMRGLGLAIPGWDLVLFKDRSAVEKYALLGVNAHHLHEAMNPLWHRPICEGTGTEVAVVGNSYGFRQSLVSRMVKAGVNVGLYGPPVPRWGLPEIRTVHRGRYISREEKSRVFGAAMACLNTFSPAEGNSLNCRAFEIAGAGGLQLIEHRSAIEECFVPGKELLVFHGFEELLAQLERARQGDVDLRRIREAGARRALSEHTYRHRLTSILQLLGLRLD